MYVLWRMLPTQHVDDLLHANAISGKDVLTRTFAVGCYLFLLIRALYEPGRAQSEARRKGVPQHGLPTVVLKQRVRDAIALRRGGIPHQTDAVVNTAHYILNVGKLVETWAACLDRHTFLGGIHRITEPSDAPEPGFLQGQCDCYEYCSYCIRVFVFVVRTQLRALQKTPW
jgi:hypothetical protein